MPSSPLPRADKALGQHFLHDAGTVEKILRFAAPLTGRHVLEIGAGPGALTRALLAGDAASVTAVELDARMIPGLEALAAGSAGRFAFHHADALKTHALSLVQPPRVIVANLPYNVGTALLLQWLGDIHAQGAQAWERLTLMFQKEVAQRIAAAPGGKEYGRLSVLAQWLCTVEYGFDVTPGCFTPPPAVTSAVLRLTPLARPRFPAEREALERVLAAGFNQRRKMLRAALRPLVPEPEKLLRGIGIDPTRRAETLGVEEWCALARGVRAVI
jgi:16S rRNA (adenine1518-N6/adenine1519-N6)-dimethyltransferase